MSEALAGEAGAASGAPAPFGHSAEAPAGAHAVWVSAGDGLRLRVGVLGRGAAGTVLLFPGRTEYVEKYGRAAASFAARGFGTVTIDWRGQGLADRMLEDPTIGHVGAFSDYQHDVAALLSVAEAEGMARPWFLLGHSMGGAIGLRALVGGLDVAAAAFSAPLWGIQMAAPLRPVAWGLGWVATRAGGHRWTTPMTERETYVLTADPADNMLTEDAEMLAYMRRHLEEMPQLKLGGPSLPWLYTTMRECRQLIAEAAPAGPVLTFLPEREAIVDAAPIRSLTARWPQAELVIVPGGRHETMMETKERREAFFDRCSEFFRRHG